MQLISGEVLAVFLKNPKNKIFIDVREPYEFNNKNIKGFQNIPFGLIKKIHKFIEQPIVLLCRSGNRAKYVAYQLEKSFPQANIFVVYENIMELNI